MDNNTDITQDAIQNPAPAVIPTETPLPEGIKKSDQFMWAYYSSHKPYCAEAAKSNRAQCRETSCKVNIGKDVLRIGHCTGDYFHWYHAPCAFKTHENRYLKNPKITSPDQIYNYENLSEEHKKLIQELIDGTYVEPPAMSYNPRPKRGCAVLKEQEQAVEKQDEQVKKEEQKKKRAKKNSD